MNRKIFNPSGYSLMGFCRNKPLRKILATWCAFATLATTSAPAWAALSDATINSVSAEIVNGGFEGDDGWENVPISLGMDQYGIAEPPYGIVREFAGVKPLSGDKMCLANFYLKVKQSGIVLKKGVPVKVSFAACPAVK